MKNSHVNFYRPEEEYWIHTTERRRFEDFLRA